MMASLEIDHLTVAYKDIVVLHDFCARIPRGVVAALIGPNGAAEMRTLMPRRIKGGAGGWVLGHLSARC